MLRVARAWRAWRASDGVMPEGRGARAASHVRAGGGGPQAVLGARINSGTVAYSAHHTATTLTYMPRHVHLLGGVHGC